MVTHEFLTISLLHPWYNIIRLTNQMCTHMADQSLTFHILGFSPSTVSRYLICDPYNITCDSKYSHVWSKRLFGDGELTNIFQVRSVLQLDRIDKDFRGPLAPKKKETDFTFSCNVSKISRRSNTPQRTRNVVLRIVEHRRNLNREDQRGERYIRGVDMVSWPRGFKDIDLTTS